MFANRFPELNSSADDESALLFLHRKLHIDVKLETG